MGIAPEDDDEADGHDAEHDDAAGEREPIAAE